MTENKKTITVKEFAEEYGLGLNKAYELVRAKGFPMFRLGKKILIISSKVDEFMESCIGKKI